MASSSQHKFRRVHLLSSAFASLTIAAPPAYAADDPVEAGGDIIVTIHFLRSSLGTGGDDIIAETINDSRCGSFSNRCCSSPSSTSTPGRPTSCTRR